MKVVKIEPIPEGERDPAIKDAIKEEGAGILNCLYGRLLHTATVESRVQTCFYVTWQIFD